MMKQSLILLVLKQQTETTLLMLIKTSGKSNAGIATSVSGIVTLGELLVVDAGNGAKHANMGN
jgi:translation elongation factor EF-4